ncbi:MAG TPA: aldehyde ferredoxin oxidoreductase family protein, partial [Syntrophomonadaceae bacterium]|nr:aldehyde ferredoxin oxidoreductase family protein [Syntrophomonadaceae bacterium]
MFGWKGQILRVNLTKGVITKEALDPVKAKEFLGARGLGTYLYMKEVSPEAEALSDENNMIFVTGPLTGTMATSSDHYNVVTKGSLTGTITASNSGGDFGPELKFAGYDGIIFEGTAPKPVYLWINDSEVELRSAEHLWGKNVPATTDALKAETDKEAKIACIGPAGENLVKLAVIVNDYNRAARRTGVGAVMGFKRLKAVVVRGTSGIQIARPEEFWKTNKYVEQKLAAHPVTGQGLCTYSTNVLVNILNQSGAFPAQKFRDSGKFDSLEKVCSGDNDLEPIIKANYYCNELGMDPISVAATIACAMELYENGYLSKKIAGYDLDFGNPEAMVELTRKTAYREGFGDLLAEGSYLLASKFSHPELSMSVKKQEIPAYDPRGIQGIGLEYAASNRGRCHVQGYMISPEILSFPEKIDPNVTKEKAQRLKIFQDLTASVDSAGLCLFTTFAIGAEEIAAQLSTATGVNYTAEAVMKVGERILNLER